MLEVVSLVVALLTGVFNSSPTVIVSVEPVLETYGKLIVMLVKSAGCIDNALFALVL